MKAKELIEKLKENPEADVLLSEDSGKFAKDLWTVVFENDELKESAKAAHPNGLFILDIARRD